MLIFSLGFFCFSAMVCAYSTSSFHSIILRSCPAVAAAAAKDRESVSALTAAASGQRASLWPQHRRDLTPAPPLPRPYAQAASQPLLLPWRWGAPGAMKAKA